jgi:hypothetical protein
MDGLVYMGETREQFYEFVSARYGKEIAQDVWERLN